MHVLIVEDDLQAIETISTGLKAVGIEVTQANNGVQGLAAVADHPEFDVIILDRMMPELDGIGFLQKIRAQGSKIPVLFLSALGEIENRVDGLKAGADDYLVKPYALSELIARLEALSRRRDKENIETMLKVGDIDMNLLTRIVTRQGQAIDLQQREFQLLEFLMRHSEQIITRTMLLEKVWEYHFDPQTNVIDVHISRLRAKIDKGFDRQMLHTIRGEGYCLKA